MGKAERSEYSNMASEKEAMRNFKQAEALNTSYIDRHVYSGEKRRKLSRALYGMGLRRLAAKVAPEEVAFMDFEKADDERMKFRRPQIKEEKVKEAKMEDALQEAFNAEPSEPLQKVPYTPRHLHTVKPLPAQQHEILPDRPVRIQKAIEERAQRDDTEQHDDQPQTPHWSEWNVWREQIDASRENEEVIEESEKPFQYFDESKKVSIIKRSEFENKAEPLTNESLGQFVENASKKLSGDAWKQTNNDFKHIIRYLIENPIGPHSTILRGTTIGVENKKHPILKVDPRKIPNTVFENPNTRTFRILFYYDGGTVVLFQVLKHEEMSKLYPGRRRD